VPRVQSTSPWVSDQWTGVCHGWGLSSPLDFDPTRPGATVKRFFRYPWNSSMKRPRSFGSGWKGERWSGGKGRRLPGCPGIGTGGRGREIPRPHGTSPHRVADVEDGAREAGQHLRLDAVDLDQEAVVIGRSGHPAVHEVRDQELRVLRDGRSPGIRWPRSRPAGRQRPGSPPRPPRPRRSTTPRSGRP